MTKQSKNDATGTHPTKTKPAWEIFFTHDQGRIIERPWEDKATGKKGTTWDRRGALWTGVTKASLPLPSVSATRFLIALRLHSHLAR